MKPKSERKKKVMVGTGLIILFLLIILFMWPGIINKIFDWASGNDVNQLHPEQIEGFEEMSDNVVVKKNITYSKQYGNRKLDVYMPKKSTGTKRPTIFWAHGGAYIAGDKKSVADYSTMLASQGYVVVNINYSLAPEYQYPTPVLQIGDAYLYIAVNAKQFGVDLERIAFGGDSAGGQIIGQFVNVQVDQQYAKKVGIEPIVKDPNTIKAAIFFSALLDINQYDENENEKANKVFANSAIDYFGLEDWKRSEIVNNANIVDNVNENYPPTYLTDGNTASFQDQAKELADQLNKSKVTVETTFFPSDEAELRHQYQFALSLKEAVENYKALSIFLEKHLKHS